jgi:hypothetical protein
LRCGRVVVAAGISICLDFEKQIQTNEITHEALTNRRMAVRIRSPLSPAATQTAFSVIIRHTTSVNNVEMIVLPSFPRDEDPADKCRFGVSKSL